MEEDDVENRKPKQELIVGWATSTLSYRQGASIVQQRVLSEDR